MDSLNWLVRSAGELANLADDRSALDALGWLARALAEGSDAAAGPADSLALLERLAQGTPTDEVVRILTAVADDRAPGLAKSLADLAALMKGRIPELGLLACPWERLRDPTCAGKVQSLDWYGLDGVAPGGNGAEPLFFDLSGHLDRGLLFQPLPEVPAELALGERAVVGLGLRGKIQSKVGGGIPVRFGAVELGAEGAGAARIDWYVARDADPYVARSFAIALDAMANPFDLNALTAAFSNKGLLGLAIEAGGGFGLGGSLSVGTTDQLLKGLGGQVGVELQFHSSRRGEFRLSVHPTRTNDSAVQGVRVDIVRTRAAEDLTAGSVGLTFDLSSALEALGPDLLAKAGKAQSLLEGLKDFIPPSHAIRETLKEQLDLQITSPDLRAALGGVLGSSTDASDLDRLRQRLESAIDSQSNLWQGNVSDLADQVAGRAMDGLPLGTHDRLLLRGLSKLVIQQGLGALREELRRELDRRIASPAQLDALRVALQRVGEPVDAGLRRVDALSLTVAGQLDRFQGVLARIATAIQGAGEVKLNARWRREERRSQGVLTDQSLLFRPNHPDAAGLFREVLAGSLEEVFEQLKGMSSQTGDGGPVTLLAGTMREFAKVRRESGLELTLLDFRLGGGDLLDAEVFIETDASGNVRVCTRAETRWSLWRPGEVSEFQAVNVFELAAARQTRHLSLSLSLSQVHKDLRSDEVQDFFEGLANPQIGLLRPEQVASALARFRRRAGRGGGELRAWMELDQGDLLRLLRLPAADKVHASALSDHDKSAIYETAIDAMVAGLQVTGSRTNLANLRHYLKTQGHGEDLRAVLKEMRIPERRTKFAPHPAEEGLMVDMSDYESLERIAKRADDLIAATQAMREIYLSPTGVSGSPEYYQDRQETIDRAFVFWARGVPLDRGWFAALTAKDRIGPYLLAFFKAISLLCRDPTNQDGGAVLLASILVPGGDRPEEIMLLSDEPGPDPVRAITPPPVGTSRPAARSPTPPSPAPSTDDRRNPTMSAFTFPLEKKISTFLTGGRRYRALRNGGRLHAGCDLTVPQGTRILAMADGTVVRGPYYFYEGTYALEIAHDNGKLVRYGEISQLVPKGVKPGARVKQGDLIATVGRLNSGSSMLHLEMYKNGSDHGALTVAGKNKFKRRVDVEDPTQALLDAPTWASQQSQATGATQVPPVTAQQVWNGKVDDLRVTATLNVRSEPKIVPGATPLLRLAPGTKVEIIDAEDGGPYPFGQGNLWYKIRHKDVVGKAVEGYVAAYFLKTDYPYAGGTGLGGDPEVGYISRLEDGLNIRSSPNTEADVLANLEKGTQVAVLSREIGGFYDSNRNDWLRIRFLTDGREKEGYAAAFYIAIGAPDASGGSGALDRDGTNPWTRVLADVQWGGASEKTAGAQLGLGIPGGIKASEGLASQDLGRVKELAGLFRDVGAKFGLPAALLAGIASRESRCGNALRNGWGDNGNGFGIMQVDRRSHPIRSASDPAGIDHIEQAAGIFDRHLEFICDKFKDWEERYQLQGATAAYNFGVDDVRNKDRIDQGSTGGDYGSDVLARARYYRGHPDLHLLRD